MPPAESQHVRCIGRSCFRRHHFTVESTYRWPVFVAHELAGFLIEIKDTVVSAIEPRVHRGEERAAEVTVFSEEISPHLRRADFFFFCRRFGKGSGPITIPSKVKRPSS